MSVQTPPRPERPCPICRKPARVPTRPFCSDRCRQVDLIQWLSEGYAIPGAPADIEAQEDRFD